MQSVVVRQARASAELFFFTAYKLIGNEFCSLGIHVVEVHINQTLWVGGEFSGQG